VVTSEMTASFSLRFRLKVFSFKCVRKLFAFEHVTFAAT